MPNHTGDFALPGSRCPSDDGFSFRDESMAHRRLNPSAATIKAQAAPGYLGPVTSSALLLRRPRFGPPAWPNGELRGLAPGIVDTTGMFSQKSRASWQKYGDDDSEAGEVSTKQPPALWAGGCSM